MTSFQATVRGELEADTTLTTILSGGIFDATELDRVGLSLFDAIKDSIGKLKPCAVIRWRGDHPNGPHFNGQDRFFEIYLYEDVGYTNINSAKERIFQLLHRTHRTADNVGIGWINFVSGDPGEFVATELGNASGGVMKFQVIYTRR